MNTDFIQIAGYASKAPSGHNTQPWKFHITDKGISVIPNLEVALPFVDGNNRELFISLGCAVENIFVSAGHFGYGACMTECSTERIMVELSKTKSVVENPLFYQIEKRQTNRSIYNGKRVPAHVLQQLQSIPKENSVRFHFAETGGSLADTITGYIMKGNDIQMDDTAFKNELLLWMRFNRRQVESTHNGLSYQVFGDPPLPRILARPIVSRFLKPAVQNKSDKKKIASSSHLVVCTIKKNVPQEWVGLGRTLQRLLLEMTKAGVAYAFLNQPCEVESLASDLQDTLPINQEYPVLILRIGYARPLPYSPRHKIETRLI